MILIKLLDINIENQKYWKRLKWTFSRFYKKSYLYMLGTILEDEGHNLGIKRIMIWKRLELKFAYSIKLKTINILINQ